ncbi:MAG: hypothetical protein J0I06_24505, partial [Planctomycetes bacterium]|nr:hypothetical protein [Planctomycetota bacterium]
PPRHDRAAGLSREPVHPKRPAMSVSFSAGSRPPRCRNTAAARRPPGETTPALGNRFPDLATPLRQVNGAVE